MPRNALAGSMNVAAVRRWWQRPTAPLLVIAAAKLVVHLATNGVYGFHRDEMYYVISGQHPALGYVDYPLVTPMLARLDTSIFGISPWALRLFPALAGAAIVVLAGLCAREMGASRGIMILASLVTLLCPLLLGANWLFETVTFDQVTWLIALYLLLRIIRTGDRRLFILLGVDLGVGLETKLTIIALCIGIVVAVLVSRDLRPSLRTRYPWIGLAIALALFAPNVAWQIANAFPSLTYTLNHRSDISSSGGPAAFIIDFVLYTGPFILPLWIAGLLFLFRTPAFRPMGVLTVVAILVLLPEGKAYYPAPVIPMVLAAGCMAVGRIVSLKRRRRVAVLVVAGAVVQLAVLLPALLPLVPTSSLHAFKLDALREDFADTVGWPELTSQVAAVYNALPASQRAKTSILASNYGEAAAIDIYGGQEHLPQALSSELTFWFWKPPDVDSTSLVTVGYNPSDLAPYCGTVTRAGSVVMPDSVVNQEAGAPILICTHLLESINAAWSHAQNFS
jgi:4-amino-4-deoxy-L-arabinose transferase-like glycosyltransferase